MPADALIVVLVALGLTTASGVHWGQHGPPDDELLEKAMSHLAGQRVDVRVTDDVLQMLRGSTDLRATKTETQIWRQRQQEMVDLTEKFRSSWFGIDRLMESHLYDGAFWQYFVQRFDADPDFFLGLVYIPVPWNHLLEGLPYLHWREEQENKSEAGLMSNYTDYILGVYELLANLSADVKYFVVMAQSHVGQLEDAVRVCEPTAGSVSGKVRWDNILVFDSRGRDNEASQYPRVPIPLLRREQYPYVPAEFKKRYIFFSASCHFDESRMMMGPGKAVPPKPEYNGSYMWDISACDESSKMPLMKFKRRLRAATWTITPPGGFPVSFMMYEALQSGSLVIVPYYPFNASHYQMSDGGLGPFNASHHQLSDGDWDESNFPFIWLPYRDIGLRWQSELAELVRLEDLPFLQDRVEGLPREDVRRRQAVLKRVQPLFRTEGLTAYILYVLSITRRVDLLTEAFGPDFSSLGFAVSFLNEGPRLKAERWVELGKLRKPGLLS